MAPLASWACIKGCKPPQSIYGFIHSFNSLSFTLFYNTLSRTHSLFTECKKKAQEELAEFGFQESRREDTRQRASRSMELDEYPATKMQRPSFVIALHEQRREHGGGLSASYHSVRMKLVTYISFNWTLDFLPFRLVVADNGCLAIRLLNIDEKPLLDCRPHCTKRPVDGRHRQQRPTRDASSDFIGTMVARRGSPPFFSTEEPHRAEDQCSAGHGRRSATAGA